MSERDFLISFAAVPERKEGVKFNLILKCAGLRYYPQQWKMKERTKV